MEKLKDLKSGSHTVVFEGISVKLIHFAQGFHTILFFFKPGVTAVKDLINHQATRELSRLFSKICFHHIMTLF